MSFGAAGLGLGLFSSVLQGIAGRRSAKYNEKVANNNAIAAEQQGAYEADQQFRQNERLLGSQLVQGAKSGASNSGSLLDSLANSAGVGQQNVDTIGYNTALQVNADRAQAKQFKNQAKSSLFTSVLSGATNLFGGLSQQLNNPVNQTNPNIPLVNQPNPYASLSNYNRVKRGY